MLFLNQDEDAAANMDLGLLIVKDKKLALKGLTETKIKNVCFLFYLKLIFCFTAA
jgi:hypothetical protein